MLLGPFLERTSLDKKGYVKDTFNFGNLYLLLMAPPKSQSHGLQPARSLLRPQYSLYRDGNKLKCIVCSCYTPICYSVLCSFLNANKIFICYTWLVKRKPPLENVTTLTVWNPQLSTDFKSRTVVTNQTLVAVATGDISFAGAVPTDLITWGSHHNNATRVTVASWWRHTHRIG